MRWRWGKLIRSGRLERERARDREGTNSGMEESFDFEVKSMAMMGKWYYELWQVSFPTTINPKGGGAAIGLKKSGNVSGSRGGSPIMIGNGKVASFCGRQIWGERLDQLRDCAGALESWEAST
ncbi:MAG: hypothetical protein ACTS7D_01620, partial [Candidatus Hodgkinia cicadicola]